MTTQHTVKTPVYVLSMLHSSRHVATGLPTEELPPPSENCVYIAWVHSKSDDKAPGIERWMTHDEIWYYIGSESYEDLVARIRFARHEFDVVEIRETGLWLIDVEEVYEAEAEAQAKAAAAAVPTPVA
ncbi:MAG TPA: hypothetical protein VG965_02475 [Patescibacteria group bacterium]|nr:hypothetical protein [Patescibacteria group bacterium]